MLDSNGYLKVIDFGLARMLEAGEIATSILGTPSYVAPEALQRAGYAFSVDWWAVGILLHEMIFGKKPFNSKTHNLLFELIKRKRLELPSQAHSPELADLLHKLLAKSPSERIGTKGGANEILSHPWFKNFDLLALETF